MVNNNKQFLIQHEEFDKNFIFPSVKNIDSQQVISLYENFKKIFTVYLNSKDFIYIPFLSKRKLLYLQQCYERLIKKGETNKIREKYNKLGNQNVIENRLFDGKKLSRLFDVDYSPKKTKNQILINQINTIHI